MEIEIATTFPAVAAVYARGAAGAPLVIAREMDEGAPAISGTVVETVKRFTPQRTGKLADSTTAEIVGAGMSIDITVTQPATSDDGTEYGPIVVSGRGAVVPVAKRALAGPDFGPVARSGPAAANDYPDEAQDAWEPLVAAGLELLAERMAFGVTSSLE